MEAKDTVIKIKWMGKDVQEDQDRLLLEQAEISFKAGYKEGVKNHHECCKMDYQAGIREVVDYIEKEHGFRISPAKLKEWGVE